MEIALRNEKLNTNIWNYSCENYCWYLFFNL